MRSPAGVEADPLTWLDHRKDWLTSGGRLQKPREETRPRRPPKPESLTVTQAAQVLGVDRRTIRKYLALDPEDEAPILFEEWFRLPGGHIRIYAAAIRRLQQE
jgi:hypothetical protein